MAAELKSCVNFGTPVISGDILIAKETNVTLQAAVLSRIITIDIQFRESTRGA